MKMAEKTIEKIIERHILVMYGSSAIDEKMKVIEKESGLKYIHFHDGSKPKPENRIENYNGNMKIKAGVIYKWKGTQKEFDYLLKHYSNLEIISDKN